MDEFAAYVGVDWSDKKMAAQMKMLLEAIKEFDREIEQLCESHQD